MSVYTYQIFSCTCIIIVWEFERKSCTFSSNRLQNRVILCKFRLCVCCCCHSVLRIIFGFIWDASARWNCCFSRWKLSRYFSKIDFQHCQCAQQCGRLPVSFSGFREIIIMHPNTRVIRSKFDFPQVCRNIYDDIGTEHNDPISSFRPTSLVLLHDAVDQYEIWQKPLGTFAKKNYYVRPFNIQPPLELCYTSIIVCLVSAEPTIQSNAELVDVLT